MHIFQDAIQNIWIWSLFLIFTQDGSMWTPKVARKWSKLLLLTSAVVYFKVVFYIVSGRTLWVTAVKDADVPNNLKFFQSL